MALVMHQKTHKGMEEAKERKAEKEALRARATRLSA